MALQVAIKHAGKAYDVELDPSKPPIAFKENIYAVTGIPTDRMKVMIKGGMLKCVQAFQTSSLPLCLMPYCDRDDTDWKKVNPKAVSRSATTLSQAI